MENNEMSPPEAEDHIIRGIDFVSSLC